MNQSGTVTGTHDYEPFGDIISGGTETRQGFNSREKDQEVALFNNGVRKLDDEEGQFTSIDPLWEKFPAWSPYQYGYNNPIRVTDPDGMQARLRQYKEIPGEGGGGGIPVGGIILPIPAPVIAPPPSGGLVSPVEAGAVIVGLGAAIIGIIEVLSEDAEETYEAPDRNPAQDKPLSPAEIKTLEDAGYDVHELKGGKSTGKIDIYKDHDGWLHLKPKGGGGTGEPLGINMNNL